MILQVLGLHLAGNLVMSENYLWGRNKNYVLLYLSFVKTFASH